MDNTNENKQTETPQEIKHPAQVVETQTSAESNPLMQRLKIPGETHRLPSGGIFYNNGELESSASNGEVHIHPMTGADEITLKSPDMLFSGEAVSRVIKRCVPQVLKPRQLLSKDVDFILVVLRKVSFGTSFDIDSTHTCEHAKKHSYSIDLSKFISESKNIDPTTIETSYTVTLENDQKVMLSPPKFNDIISLYQKLSMKAEDVKMEDVEKQLYDTISSTVMQVDEITDEKLIRQWIESIPAGWLHKLSDNLQKMSDWGPDFNVKITCKDCGEEATLSTPLNPIAFFM